VRALELALPAALTALAAAQNEPRAAYVFPAGASRGTTVEVTVGGRALQEPSAAFVSGDGVTAVVRGSTRPLTNKERTELRDQIQALEKAQRDGTIDAAGREQLAAARKRLAASPRQPMNPQLAETVLVAVTVAADTAPGPRELRVRTAAGLANPLRFVIGDGRAVRELEPNDRAADKDAAAALPVTIDGQIMPGDVDRFRVTLQQGQRLVAAVQARALIPYIADAVPGWCQATLLLRDPQGREVAYVDDHRFDPDPRLEYDVPADGDYEVELRDALCRGREDFVYRLELRTAGAGSTAAAAAPPPLGPFEPVAEREPNDAGPAAQVVELPAVVLGRVAAPGDVDVYAIDGRPGQVLVAEVLARRIGSPLDAVLRLCDPGGREVAQCDDFVDPGSGLVTHQADAWLRWKFGVQGRHLLTVRDLQGKGGDAYTYRLRLGPPVPDFALRIVPSQVNLRAGTAAVLTVHALRRDGFAGEIALALAGPDAGFALGGGVVPAGLDKVLVTLTAPAEAPEHPVALAITGTATIGKGEVVHAAVPAEDMMQAFLWQHLVPSQQLLACVLRGGPGLGRLARTEETPLALRPGGTAEAVFTLVGARRAFAANLTCRLRDPPAGISVAETRLARDGFHVVIKAEKTVAAGLSGNLILEAAIDRPQPAAGGTPPNARPGRQRFTLVLPAVRFVVRKGPTSGGGGPP